ncbi:uncharacterized protein LOC124170031 [Ischnura elegans]|uniref:uncharacterized protein LOC124170031 n=1 Tax=Ischnura elegans TaxID=197161 RepID=UPI001ED8A7D9|nr:uncharacterized protein LOC124170031 [Ischnura elegans]
MDQDLIPEEKVKHLEELLDGMHLLERVLLRIYIFVILSQLRRATMTMRRPEEGPSSTNQVGNIVQKLLELVMTKRLSHDFVLSLQKIRGNSIWRFNHLDEYRERITEEGVGRMEKFLYDICGKMVVVNYLLLSSSIEQMVVRWPSLEHYAQGRVSNPVHFCRGNSEADIQTLTNVINSSSNISIKWLHLALSEMLSEQQEWANIVSSRVISRNGDDSADVDMESIIIKALKTTTSILGLGTEPSVMDANDGDETCSMFRIEYLDEEKFTDMGDMEIISKINKLVSLNRSLLRLRWSLDKSIKDYVQASESEEGAERATQCQEANITFGDYIGMFQKKTENRLLQLGEAEFKRLMSIEGLLFDVEKDMLKEMGQYLIMENMSRVALIVPRDEEVEISDMLPPNADNNVLERAINAHMRSKKKDLQARKFEVFLLMLFPFLYLLDIGTDIYVAYKHCSEANYIYFGLTLVFIFGPMLADLIGNMYCFSKSSTEDSTARYLTSLPLLFPHSGDMELISKENDFRQSSKSFPGA